METNPTTRGKVRYRYKFLIVTIVGMLLLVSSSFLDNKYLNWSAGIVLAFGAFYAIMSVFELFDKLEE